MDRARALPEEVLHERVDGEWSFVETLRHLLFVTDAWLKRAVLADPAPYHPLDLPHTDMPASAEGVPNDPDARPPLDEVLSLRAERQALVRDFFATLSDERLASPAVVTGPGYPEAGEYAVAALPPRGAERGVVAPALRRARPQRAGVALSGRRRALTATAGTIAIARKPPARDRAE